MTPQEKAKDLVNKFYSIEITFSFEFENEDTCILKQKMILESAKECALILVNEILDMYLPIGEIGFDEFYNYWNEVKKEIENLEP